MWMWMHLIGSILPIINGSGCKSRSKYGVCSSTVRMTDCGSVDVVSTTIKHPIMVGFKINLPVCLPLLDVI